jgi:hypothetical protein
MEDPSAPAGVSAARERRSTPVIAAEACGGVVHAEGRGERQGVTFRDDDRGRAMLPHSAWRRPPPPSTEIGARQATWRDGDRPGYADGTRRARYACQIRRHSGAVTDDAPACWVR